MIYSFDILQLSNEPSLSKPRCIPTVAVDDFVNSNNKTNERSQIYIISVNTEALTHKAVTN